MVFRSCTGVLRTRAIRSLIDEGVLLLRSPDFERYSDLINVVRRRIADDDLPEHAVNAEQYIPAIVCEFARDGDGEVIVAIADQKLRSVILDLAERS